MSSESQAAPQRLNPLWYRTVKAVFPLAESIGLVKELEAGRLMDSASRVCRREFGNTGFVEGLEVLLASVKESADLNGFGRLMLGQLCARYLENRLRMEQWCEQHPDVAAQKVTAPLIIAGLPRTGTTFLFGLLSQDEQFRAPRTFEIDKPVPPPAEDALLNDPRVKQVQRGIDVIHTVVPHFKAIHELGAKMPDECQQITSYQFSCITFQHIMHVPAYREWLLEYDFHADLEFHKHFLQYLQTAWMRDRWLLKSPAHVQYLKTLLDVYPDAKVIHTHREPVDVIGSISSLSWTMQDVFSNSISKKVAGKGQLDFWEGALNCALRDRELLGDSRQLFDLRYEEFIADPMQMMEQLYAHFGLELSAQTRERMLQYLSTNTQQKSGRHIYRASDFGVDALDKSTVYRQYSERFVRI